MHADVPGSGIGETRPAAGGHVASLDGLRFLAFFAVFVYHAFQNNERVAHLVGYGALGVQVFFVLSGFLIGGGLLGLRARSEGPRFARLKPFYARRALRIFPLYYLTLALLLVIERAGIDSVGGSESLVWNATYTNNIKFFLDGQMAGGLSHLWSLAVEEHFYLFVPLLVLTLTTRQLSWVCVAVGAGAAVGRVGLWASGAELGSVLSPMQFDCMMIGVAAAILVAEGRFLGIDRRRATVIWTVAVALCVPVLLARQLHTSAGALVREATENGVVAVASAGVIVALWTHAAGRWERVLALRPLTYLGKISYGLYVFHLPCLVFAAAWFSFLPAGTSLPALAMTVTLATLSWRFVEGPVNAQKYRFPMAPAGPAELPTPMVSGGAAIVAQN